MQIELLHKYGIENPETGLKDKVVGYQFGQKIDVRDPHTMIKDKKPLKPFMVNNSVIVFEKEKIVLEPSDKLLIEQLESYRIKTISSTGIPTFTDENEHAVDALNLCLLIFEQKYGTLFKSIISSKILAINEFRRMEIDVDRKIATDTNNSSPLLILSVNNNNSDVYNRLSSFDNNSSRRNSYGKRSFVGRSTFTRGRY